MINQTTYEHYGQKLASSAEKVTLTVGAALKWVLKRVISNPDIVFRDEQAYMNRVEQAAGQWTVDWQAWAQEELAKAYLQGIWHTNQELRALDVSVRQPTHDISPTTPLMPQQPRSRPNIPQKTAAMFRNYPNHLTMYGVFMAAAYDSLEGTHLQIMRQSRDLYRDVTVMAGEASFREGDIFTRRSFSQHMLNDFAQRGLQCIFYRDGRRMSLDAYAEMVGRTLSGRAAMQASFNRYEEFGYDLVRVTQHFITCPLCAPWEGRVLSLSGDSPHYASMDDAVADGLFHPNCAHDAVPYIPGVSEALELHVDPEAQRLIDQHGYKEAQKIAYQAQQKQRAIERNIRHWRRREVVALDETEEQKAKAKVREWQKVQREHLSRYPFLPRKYHREAV